MIPIATIRTPFREKFGTPSGAMRVPSARGIIEFAAGYSDPHAFAGLEAVSHLWIIYLFHQHAQTPWRAKVRPPRLGGEKKVGVFATRSPVRPNPIGLSCVALERIETTADGVRLHVRGVDMVDGTPILDIKPYQADVDCVPGATLGWTQEHPWSAPLKVRLATVLENRLNAEEWQLLREVLALDPRPSRQRQEKNQERYHLWLGQWDVTWQIEGEEILVTDLIKRP